jgi:hypothetical protein
MVVTQISGKHLSHMTNGNVQGFTIENQQNVNFLPTKIGKFFPNLIAINVKNSKLVGIFEINLVGLKKLKFLNLGHNQIQGVKAGTFKDNSELEMIILDHNNIAQIDAKAFDNLNYLRSLHLADNSCQTAFINADDQKSIEKLRKIIKDGICVTPILPKSMKTLKNLKPMNQRKDKIITKLHKRMMRLIKCLQAAVGLLLIVGVVLVILVVAFIRIRRGRSSRLTNSMITNGFNYEEIEESDDDEVMVVEPGNSREQIVRVKPNILVVDDDEILDGKRIRSHYVNAAALRAGLPVIKVDEPEDEGRVVGVGVVGIDGDENMKVKGEILNIEDEGLNSKDEKMEINEENLNKNDKKLETDVKKLKFDDENMKIENEKLKIDDGKMNIDGKLKVQDEILNEEIDDDNDNESKNPLSMTSQISKATSDDEGGSSMSQFLKELREKQQRKGIRVNSREPSDEE